MIAWAAANPIATCFLIVVGLVALCWLGSWIMGDIERDCCDHSECERPHTGDIVVEIFESKRQSAGDGVESGV